MAPADANPANDRSAPSEPPTADQAAGHDRIRSSKERQRLRLYAALLSIDIASILFGFCVANLARFGNFAEGPGLSLGFGCLPLFIPLAFGDRSYSIDILANPRLGIRRALKALAIATGALVIALFYSKTAGDVSRIVFAGGAATAALTMIATRYVFGQLVGHRHGWVFINEVLLVDGLAVQPNAGQIVVFADQLGVGAYSNDPESFDRLGRLLSNCDRVTLASPPERRMAWASTLKCVGIAVEVLAPELDGLRPLGLRQADHHSALLVSVGPLGLRDRMLKRGLDLAVAIPGLILASPLLLLIAIGVKLSSRGPVFFRQPRVGESNCIFNVLKFRSMRVETSDHDGARSASRDDDRITKLGRFLRKTSLDELPQLINVVKGDMSLVGPRPHALGSTAGDRLFWVADSRYWQRGAVRPGITGLAQIRGFRGATHEEADLTNRVQADLEYLSGWSIWRDIHILVQTAKVLIHPNAY